MSPIVKGLATGAGAGVLKTVYDDLTSRSVVEDDVAGEKRAVGAIVKGLATGAGAGILKTVYDDLTSRSINELD